MKKPPKTTLLPDTTIDRVEQSEKKIHDLEEWASGKKMDDRVNAKIRAICITSTSAGITACIYVGNLLYDNILAVTAGVRAFWEVFSKGPPH